MPPARTSARRKGIPHSLDSRSRSSGRSADLIANLGVRSGLPRDAASSEDDREDAGERAARDEQEYPEWMAVIEELAEDQRRDHAADVQPGGHEAEHLAERAGWGGTAHDHVARRDRHAAGKAAYRRGQHQQDGAKI